MMINKDMKKGFTLIEMLIVIGILGILMTVLLGTFSGGTESARAARCISNLRNLSAGAISTAMATGAYPAAGSYAGISPGGNGIVYYERIGWISWLSQNDPYHMHDGKAHPSSYQKVDSISAFCENEENVTFALTNGSVWASVRRDRDTYVCPLHKRIAAQKNKGVPRFSYCMNCFFGYSSNNGSASKLGDEGVEFNKWYVKPDRRLLFAEIPFGIAGSTDSSNDISEDDAFSTSYNTLTDCTLQYKAHVGGDALNTTWNGPAEAIAFNHKNGKRFVAHVSFADGHTEKLLKARGDDGITAVQLTALLCAAKQYAFDGRRYQTVTTSSDNDNDAQD